MSREWIAAACLAAIGILPIGSLAAIPREIEPLTITNRAQTMPIITEEKKGREALRAEVAEALTAARAERDLFRRELVKTRMHLQRLQFELETTRYKQEMKARLAGSVAILVVAVLVSLIAGLWRSLRELRRVRPSGSATAAREKPTLEADAGGS